VLLVEDDASVRQSTVMLLERAGIRVTDTDSGEAALQRFERDPHDLVLLDVMLPGIDGFEVCRQVRRTSQVPIVMLTARGELHDIVAGLELGADDYVVKPFEGAELVARVRAVLRRNDVEPATPAVTIAGIEIDPVAFRAQQDGRPLELTATEFRLLFELARHAGQVMTRELLLERVWGYDYLGDSRLVDMAVKRLRDKLDGEAGRRGIISTVRGVGYRFERSLDALAS
jgi:two-component system response regulator MtrA